MCVCVSVRCVLRVCVCVLCVCWHARSPFSLFLVQARTASKHACASLRWHPSAYPSGHCSIRHLFGLSRLALSPAGTLRLIPAACRVQCVPFVPFPCWHHAAYPSSL